MRSRDRHAVEEVDADGSWAISYGDLITVVLTFFILFFNVNRTTSDSTRLEMQESLVTSLKSTFSEPKLVSDEKDSAMNALEKSQFVKWGGRVYQNGQKIVVEFPGVSFFKVGQTDVTPEAVGVLKQFVKAYEPYMGHNSLSVKAFTDTLTVAPGRRFHDNLELSALRAISAMRHLQELGIPLHLMRISGQGEYQSAVRKLASDEEDLGIKQKGDPSARKVVLIVEPATQEKL
jgi:chemotaxis protein MotB